MAWPYVATHNILVELARGGAEGGYKGWLVSKEKGVSDTQDMPNTLDMLKQIEVLSPVAAREVK